MPVTPIEIATARAADRSKSEGSKRVEASLEALDANAEARTELRRQADRREFRQALHDLAEGLRGVIRANPLVAAGFSVALGMMWARRRRA